MEHTRTIIAFLMLIATSSFAIPFTVSELAWPKATASGASGLSDLTNGLVAHYRFDTNDNSGGIISGRFDSSGNGYHLTEYGTAMYQYGRVTTNFGSSVGVSNALSIINGSGTFGITNSEVFNLIGDRTFTMWVYNGDNLGLDHGLFFGQLDPSAPSLWNYTIGMDNSDTNLAWGMNNVGASNTMFAVNQWHFIIWEYQHTNLAMTLQIDMGQIFTINGGPAQNINPAYSNWFGAIPINTPFEKHQKLDEVSIWNRLLLTVEKTNLWNSGWGKTYPFIP